MNALRFTALPWPAALCTAVGRGVNTIVQWLGASALVHILDQALAPEVQWHSVPLLDALEGAAMADAVVVWLQSHARCRLLHTAHGAAPKEAYHKVGRCV